MYNQFLAPVNEQFVRANPFCTLETAVVAASGTTRGAAMDVILALVRNQMIASFVLAGAATLGVRRAHLAQRGKADRRRWRLSQVFRPAIGNRPMLWKEIFAEPAASRLGWVGRIALTLLVLVIVGVTFYMFFKAQTMTGNSPYRQIAEEYLAYALSMGSLLGCGGLLLVASLAASSIASERERDCWTSLISTPLGAGEIVWAKIAGSIWSLRGLVLLLLLIWGLGVLLDPPFLVAVPFLLGTFLLLALYAAALGVVFSLRCNSSLRAMGATLAVGLIAGGGYICCCMPLMVIGGGSGGGDDDHLRSLHSLPARDAGNRIRDRRAIFPELGGRNDALRLYLGHGRLQRGGAGAGGPQHRQFRFADRPHAAVFVRSQTACHGNGR